MTFSAPLAVILFVFAGAIAALPQQKTAAEWTLEQRIARRLDPDDVRRRLAVQPPRPAVAEGRSTAQPVFVIDGATDPELFLPWELMDHFLQMTRPDRLSAMAVRAGYKSDLAIRGWDEERFWAAIDALSTEYFAALNAALDGTHRLCGARSDALQAGRERYGDAFNEFLYATVAPKMTLQSAVPADAPTLRWVEGGCR